MTILTLIARIAEALATLSVSGAERAPEILRALADIIRALNGH